MGKSKFQTDCYVYFQGVKCHFRKRTFSMKDTAIGMAVGFCVMHGDSATVSQDGQVVSEFWYDSELHRKDKV